MDDLLPGEQARAMDAALWGFLLAVYARPGVQAACLEVQDRTDADIVLLLVWAWHLRPDRVPLGPEAISAVQSLVFDWRQHTVLPLRRLRVDLRAAGPTMPDAARTRLRERIKALELGAERTQTAMIAGWLAAHPPTAGDAEAGLSLILDPPQVAQPLALIRQAALLV